MYTYIYRITSPNNKSYIGQVNEVKGIRNRWLQHINTSKKDPTKGSRVLNLAILKYGHENFKIEILCKIHENIKDQTEQFCIAFYNTLVPNGYNLQTGGTFTKHSIETKQKRSQSLKKLLENPDKRKVWSNVKKGKPQNNKNNRKYKDDQKLPKYMRCIRGKYEGYCVDSHPLCNCKKFTSIKLTMDEKYSLCIKFLEELNNKVAVQRLDGSGPNYYLA
jgi:group I intron endonuclease